MDAEERQRPYNLPHYHKLSAFENLSCRTVLKILPDFIFFPIYFDKFCLNRTIFCIYRGKVRNFWAKFSRIFTNMFWILRNFLQFEKWERRAEDPKNQNARASRWVRNLARRRALKMSTSLKILISPKTTVSCLGCKNNLTENEINYSFS